MQILKKVFERDVEAFGKFFFPQHLKIQTPQFHKEIYAAFENPNLLRLAFGAPRGHAKSTITDLVYLTWVIVHNKAHFILQVSDTYSQAVLFLEAVKAELESNDRLKMFYGNLIGTTWSQNEIVTNGIMIKAIGAGMKVRGLKYRAHRPDLIIGDDLENEELVDSKERREKLERWVNGALIPTLAKGGRIIFIGTILHYDSLLAKILDANKYKEFFKKTYKAITDGKALWPEHLNLKELERIKQDYQAKGQGYLFYQEYQNDPVSDENRKFKQEKVKFFTQEQIKGKTLNIFITIDRAYSTAKTADFTAIIVVGVDKENNWYILLAERWKGIEKDLITKMFDLKTYFNPVKIGIEQKAFIYTFKPYLEDEMRRTGVFFEVEELKDLGRGKNLRIEGLLPRFEAGTIHFKDDQLDLIDELIKFPRSGHDDLSDALAYQLAMAYKPEGGMETGKLNQGLYSSNYS